MSITDRFVKGDVAEHYYIAPNEDTANGFYYNLICKKHDEIKGQFATHGEARRKMWQLEEIKAQEEKTMGNHNLKNKLKEVTSLIGEFEKDIKKNGESKEMELTLESLYVQLESLMEEEKEILLVFDNGQEIRHFTRDDATDKDLQSNYVGKEYHLDNSDDKYKVVSATFVEESIATDNLISGIKDVIAEAMIEMGVEIDDDEGYEEIDSGDEIIEYTPEVEVPGIEGEQMELIEGDEFEESVDNIVSKWRNKRGLSEASTLVEGEEVLEESRQVEFKEAIRRYEQLTDSPMGFGHDTAIRQTLKEFPNISKTELEKLIETDDWSKVMAEESEEVEGEILDDIEDVDLADALDEIDDTEEVELDDDIFSDEEEEEIEDIATRVHNRLEDEEDEEEELEEVTGDDIEDLAVDEVVDAITDNDVDYDVSNIDIVEDSNNEIETIKSELKDIVMEIKELRQDIKKVEAKGDYEEVDILLSILDSLREERDEIEDRLGSAQAAFDDGKPIVEEADEDPAEDEDMDFEFEDEGGDEAPTDDGGIDFDMDEGIEPEPEGESEIDFEGDVEDDILGDEVTELEGDPTPEEEVTIDKEVLLNNLVEGFEYAANESGFNAGFLEGDVTADSIKAWAVEALSGTPEDQNLIADAFGLNLSTVKEFLADVIEHSDDLAPLLIEDIDNITAEAPEGEEGGEEGEEAPAEEGGEEEMDFGEEEGGEEEAPAENEEEFF